MRKRPITALLAALALLAAVPAASRAQDPTPTPSPTATVSQDDGSAAEAPKDASKEVKAIYDDFSRDGVIDVCKHARDDLQEALDTIEPDFDRDFPDFREAVEAGIQRHDSNRCDATPSPTPTATASPDATATASPTPSSESGALPPPTTGGSSGGDDGGGKVPPVEDGTLPPEEGGSVPEGPTPQPPAATPTAAPPAAATTPAASPTPVVVTSSGTDGLLLPGILVAIALLGAAALAISAIGGRSPRVRHAWSEARFRARGTWADFSDWLKLGR